MPFFRHKAVIICAQRRMLSEAWPAFLQIALSCNPESFGVRVRCASDGAENVTRTLMIIVEQTIFILNSIGIRMKFANEICQCRYILKGESPCAFS